MDGARRGGGEGAGGALEALARRNRAPVGCMVQLTWRCNFRCAHCYQARRSGRELGTAAWRRVLEGLASSGVLLLAFSGGEPLLRRDFTQLARAARGLTFSLKLKTNGWLLGERIADELARLRFAEVQMSLYAARPEAHDAVTGRAGSFARALRAARLLGERGVPARFMVPLMRVNAGGVGEVVRLARELGCDYQFDPSLTVCEDGSCAPLALRPSRAQLVRALRALARLEGKERFAPLRGGGARTLDAPVCKVGAASAVVQPDGIVRPCALLPVALGDLTRQSLREIWEGSAPLAGIAAIRWRDLPRCRSCRLVPYCMRCHASALFESGDLRGVSAGACAVAAAFRDAARPRGR